MYNIHAKERVKFIIDSLNSLTIEEFLKVAEVTELKKSGGKWRGKCPMHGGDSKSFTIYAKAQGIFYHCPTSCGGGNTVKLLAKLNNLETKGRDFVSVMNIAAGRMGLPGVEGGELTPQQIETIEKKKAAALIVREAREAEEKRIEILTHRVCTQMFLDLGVSEPVVSYLHDRGILPKTTGVMIGASMAHAKMLGVRSWEKKCVSKLLEHFSATELKDVLGDGKGTDDRGRSEGDRLQEQFSKRPLLMFSFRRLSDGQMQCCGFQGRSIDPDCEKRWRYISRGNLQIGYFGGEQLEGVSGPLVIVEGMTDALMGRRFPEVFADQFDGVEPTVIGKPGASCINKRAAEGLKGRKVLIVFDGDEAGKKGSRLSALVLKELGCDVEYTTTANGDLCDMIVRLKGG